VKRRLGLVAAFGALAVALALVLTACGGGGGDSNGVASLNDNAGQTTANGSQGSNGGSVSEREREQAQLDYARCMREHGVDFPDPVNGRFEVKTEKRDMRKLEEAERACRHILRDVAPPPLSEEQEAEMREAALDFARCMRERGIDMPDPTFPAGGGMLMRMPAGAQSDPDFEEAQEACQPLLEAAKPDRPAGKGGSS
jgi:hypothetical protein